MTLKRGLADVGLVTTNQPGTNTTQFLNQTLFAYPCLDMEYTRKGTAEDAMAYRAGRHVIEETIESKTEYSIKLKTQITNWAMTGLARGQIQRTLSDITVPVVRRAKIPATGIVADTLITANLPVLATIESYGSWGQAGPIPVASVVAASGTLTFPTTLAGATITYMFDRTMATARAYGGAGTLKTMDEFQLIAYVKDNTGVGEDGFIWIPQMKRKTLDVTLQFTGKLVEYEIEFTPTIPAGWEEPDMEVDGHSIQWAV
jgi:hypothetical protein